MHILVLILKGIVYGVTNLLPGIGGGLVLIILGIYEQYVGALGNLFTDRRHLRQNLSFLIPMGIGTALGMVAFAKMVEALLERYPVPAMFFFMGLVIGTIPSVLKIHGDMRVTRGRVVALLIGFVIAILPKIAERQGLRVGVSLAAATPGGFVYYVVANLLAGGASVTPGLDGSYMWMLTGIFEPVMAAIGSVTELRSALSAGGLGAALQSVHWVVLVATGVGAVVGIFFVSKLIDTAIKRWPSVTYYVILGLVAASIYGLWPASHGYGESASTTVWPVGVAVNPLDIVVVLIAFAVGVAITLYSGSRGEPEAGAARSVSEHAA